MSKIKVNYETSEIKVNVVRKSILIPEPQYEMLRALAESDNRPMANYLKVLIEKEYEKLIGVRSV